MISGGWHLVSGIANVSPLFALLTVVLVLAVLVSLVLVKFKQSLLVGYILSGVMIGNSGLLWITGVEQGNPLITNFAEVGVILLMFTLGIEFSLSEFKHLWRTSLIGGGLQVGITVIIVGAAAMVLGFPNADSLILGVTVALSSTAVAMMSFQGLGQQHNSGARASLGIALFQDILVIVFILIMPALYGHGDGSVGGQTGIALLRGGLFLIGAWLLGKYGLTPLLHAVARTRSRELFTLTVVGLCVGVAFAGGALNLSLALGAFAAGLVVSESIYRHRILTDILPFKDLFLAIFFISVGLLIDLSIIAEDWLRILLISLCILTLKGGVAFVVLKWIRLPSRPALIAAGSLASTGEFSLVLMSKANEYRPFDPSVEQVILVCTAITMAAVPSLMRAAGPFSKKLEARGIFATRKISPEAMTPVSTLKKIHNHAIICGYGTVGRSLNEALKRCGVDTLVMELNSDTVRMLKREGQAVLFADATHPEALDLAGIQRAQLVAFTFPSVRSTAVAVPLVRERNSEIYIFGRAKFPSEAAQLKSLGIQVIHDERESAVAMVRAAISSYQRPDVDPESIVGDILAKADD